MQPSADAWAVARAAQAVRRWGGLGGGSHSLSIRGEDVAAQLATLGPLLAALPAEQRRVTTHGLRGATAQQVQQLGQQLPASVRCLHLYCHSLAPGAWGALLPSLPASVEELRLEYGSHDLDEEQVLALRDAAVRPIRVVVRLSRYRYDSVTVCAFASRLRGFLLHTFLWLTRLSPRDPTTCVFPCWCACQTPVPRAMAQCKRLQCTPLLGGLGSSLSRAACIIIRSRSQGGTTEGSVHAVRTQAATAQKCDAVAQGHPAWAGAAAPARRARQLPSMCTDHQQRVHPTVAWCCARCLNTQHEPNLRPVMSPKKPHMNPAMIPAGAARAQQQHARHTKGW